MVNQRVRVYGREDLGVGEVLRVSEAGGLYQADVVFEGSDGRRLETFPLDRLQTAPSLWERLDRGDLDPPLDFLLKQLAYQLPLANTGGELSNSRTALLPHQILLTYEVVGLSRRRLLIADEVGLGKTIETGIIVRELLARGEAHRILIVSPAGLLKNWQNELWDCFRLHFAVLGLDFTEANPTAWELHPRVIASIDTLKRPERLRRLLNAPRWDLVVFDEAHHLSRMRYGTRVQVTRNFRLAEALRGYTRDLLFLSATPHQGDPYQFWSLIQLLDDSLFENPEALLDHRGLLNRVMVRRTKREVTDPEGTDQKFDTLVRAIEQLRRVKPSEKFLIFTQYRETLEFLKEELGRLYGPQRIATIKGGPLEEKLLEIARAIGKVDPVTGQVVEDLRSEILGFLGSSPNYQELYKRALVDRDYRRTEWEIAEAVEKAQQASEALRAITQDLNAFNLEQYRTLRGHFTLADLRLFVERAILWLGGLFIPEGDFVYLETPPALLSYPNVLPSYREATFDRDLAMRRRKAQLLGLGHPLVDALIDYLQSPRMGGEITCLVDPGVTPGSNPSGYLSARCLIHLELEGGRRQKRYHHLLLTPEGSWDEAPPRFDLTALQHLRQTPPRPSNPSAGLGVLDGRLHQAISTLEARLRASLEGVVTIRSAVMGLAVVSR